MENLMQTLQRYRDVDGVDGVMHVHDDALVNLTKLFEGGVDPVRRRSTTTTTLR